MPFKFQHGIDFEFQEYRTLNILVDFNNKYVLKIITLKMNGNIDCLFFNEDRMTNRKKLFEEAITSSRSGRVLYIMKEELEELPELSQDLGSVDRHYMKMISFLYAKSLESLIESISFLSNWQNVPATIILDDLSLYCGVDNIQNACGIVAFLIDSICTCEMFLKQKCRLLISVTKDSVGDEYCNTLSDLYF